MMSQAEYPTDTIFIEKKKKIGPSAPNSLKIEVGIWPLLTTRPIPVYHTGIGTVGYAL